MKRIVFIIILLPSLGFGQSLLNDFKFSNDSNNFAIQVYSDVFYQSQGISNDLMSKFIRGGNINTDLKSKIESQLTSEKNRFAVGISTGLKFYDISDSALHNPDWGFAINVEHHTLINSSFTSDLFHAVFVGNADRVGQDMNMGPSSFNSVSYQEFGFSLVYKPKGCEFGVSIIKGQSHQSLRAKTLTLNTAADISNLSLETEGDFRLSDSAQGAVTLGTMNGIGAAINVAYYIPIGKPKNSFASFMKDERPEPNAGSLRIGVKNLGFVSWFKNPVTYSSDTMYEFNGYEIQNIFDNDYSNWFNADALRDSIFPEAESGSYATLLPATFSLTYIPTILLDKKLFPIAGASYRINANARPLIYGGVQYVLSNSISGSVIGIFGGYGDITAGLRIKYTSDQVSAFISSNNIAGMLSKNGYGNNLNLGLIWRL
ncbi:MAG: hypothetical protein ACI9J3_001632 [Parvicellaceae bacterium]